MDKNNYEYSIEDLFKMLLKDESINPDPAIREEMVYDLYRLYVNRNMTSL